MCTTTESFKLLRLKSVNGCTWFVIRRHGSPRFDEFQSMASRLHCDRAYLTGHPNWTELTLWIPVCSSYLAPSPFDKRASWGVYMLPSLTVGDPNLVSCLEPQVLRDLFLLSFSGMCLIIGMPMTFFYGTFQKGKIWWQWLVDYQILGYHFVDYSAVYIY